MKFLDAIKRVIVPHPSEEEKAAESQRVSEAKANVRESCRAVHRVTQEMRVVPRITDPVASEGSSS